MMMAGNMSLNSSFPSDEFKMIRLIRSTCEEGKKKSDEKKEKNNKNETCRCLQAPNRRRAFECRSKMLITLLYAIISCLNGVNVFFKAIHRAKHKDSTKDNSLE